MKKITIAGHCQVAPPPENWRQQLVQMLGEEPRRMGLWAELGLYGALSCMASAGETRLPASAILLASSRSGALLATQTALAQMQDDLPMPLAFLQTQPSQVFARLAAHWRWQGNACFMVGATLAELQELAALQMGPAGALIGLIDDIDSGATEWLRLLPTS